MDLDEYLEKIYNRTDWTMIPEYMIDSIKNWIEHGWLPGSFLQAMLRRNFSDIVWHEDIKEHQLARWNVLLLRSGIGIVVVVFEENTMALCQDYLNMVSGKINNTAFPSYSSSG